MDVIDRFQSGLFVRQVNANRAFVPHSDPPTDRGDYYLSTTRFIKPIPHSDSDRDTPLPLLGVSVDVDLNGRLSTTKITQKFTNASACVAQNARYLFPIYNGSVVTSFKCWVGPDKLLEGDVKPKEVARAEFQQAAARHKAAVLVEEVTPEIFETSLGNIPAQTTVKVEIAYTGLLKVDISTGGLVLNIPTSVAPRYGTAPDEYRTADSLPTEGLRVNIQASMPAAIRKMESGTHPISVEIGAVSHQNFHTFAAGASSEKFDPSKARASLADKSAILDKDFILFIALSSSREFMQSQAVAASQPGNPGRSTVAVSISPGNLFLPMVNTDDFNGEIIFVADRSGSMSERIASLIDVMNVFLRSLPEQCSFNIASFGSSVSWLWPVSKAYNQEQLDMASKHVEQFQANLGGTEILSALESVRDHHDKRLDISTNVILLTDGEIWDVDGVIQFARNAASDRDANIRFFALGIGDRVSHRLVEGIGQQGGGCAEIVAESSPGSWEGRVIQMLKAALTPPRLRCGIDIGQLNPSMETLKASELSDHKLELPPCIQAPHHIPVLNAFSQVFLYYMLDCDLDILPETVTITGLTDKGRKFTAQLPLQKSDHRSGIHHLAAKALMNDYEIGQSWMHAANSALRTSDPVTFERILKQHAQHLGQQWSITSKWTSYVAIDRDTAQRHEISLCKADSVEVSELTRPRKSGMLHLSANHGGPAGCYWSSFPMGEADSVEVSELTRSRKSGIQHLSTNHWKPAGGHCSSITLGGSSRQAVSAFPARSSRARRHSRGSSDKAQFERSSDRLIDRSCDRSSDRLIDRLSGGSSEALIDRSSNRLSDRSSDRSRERARERRYYSMTNSLKPGKLAEEPLLLNSPDSRLDKECSDIGHEYASDVLYGPPTNTSESLVREGSAGYGRAERSVLPSSAWVTKEGLANPTDLFSLSRILCSQAADGEFRLCGTNLQGPLIEQFKAVIHFRTQSPIYSQDHKSHSIDLGVLAIVYIITRHATFKGLWELQVEKARRWIKRMLVELLPHDGNPSTPSRVPVELVLEKLEMMARAELLDDSEVSDNT